MAELLKGANDSVVIVADGGKTLNPQLLAMGGGYTI
jgi:hypothetical protein